MSTPEATGPRRQRGLSLIELIVFILVLTIGVAAILSVLDLTAARSSDPLVRKQALAVAEALLEEIRLMPFTYCDPDDPAAGTASGVAACALPETLGPEPGESRHDPSAPFDNVNDYHGFAMAPVADFTGTPIAGLSAYSASVQIAEGGLAIPSASDVLRIAVTVAGPGESVTLHGYRTRYAPNATP
jgi:MSHA pilin protein MshD